MTVDEQKIELSSDIAKGAYHEIQPEPGDQHVGEIAIDGWKGAWGIGRFTPNESFAAFESMFSEWSVLMHADAGPMRQDVANRLRELEYRMYALRCRLYLVGAKQWRQILILNIDGAMVEWKEGWNHEPADVEDAAGIGTLTVLQI